MDLECTLPRKVLSPHVLQYENLSERPWPHVLLHSNQSFLQAYLSRILLRPWRPSWSTDRLSLCNSQGEKQRELHCSCSENFSSEALWSWNALLCFGPAVSSCKSSTELSWLFLLLLWQTSWSKIDDVVALYARHFPQLGRKRTNMRKLDYILLLLRNVLRPATFCNLWDSLKSTYVRGKTLLLCRSPVGLHQYDVKESAFCTSWEGNVAHSLFALTALAIERSSSWIPEATWKIDWKSYQISRVKDRITNWI